MEKRKVFLKGGWAYVHAKEQSSIIYQEFQTKLEEALEVILLLTIFIYITIIILMFRPQQERCRA